MKSLYILPFLRGILLSGAAMLAPMAFSQTPDTMTEETEELSPIEKASELYKQLKTLQFDGASDEDYYPAVYAAFDQAFGMLMSGDLTPADAEQCKAILLDINTALSRGAFYYSTEGKKEEMCKFARAYVDSQLMPAMEGADFHRDKSLYPTLVYCAASGSYNAGDIDNAIRYFEEYMSTGETGQREQVSLFYGQALLNTKKYDKGVETVVKASEEYPANYQLLTIAMQLCIDSDRKDILAPLVERALTIKPDDEKLLNLQASVYESQHNFNGALDIYLQLEQLHPQSLSINESVARCYYNLGTGYYNKSISELKEKEVAKQRRQSNAYFSSAAEKYEELLANAPTNPVFLKALASAYACLGNRSKVESLNVQLSAIGQQPISLNPMPMYIGNSSSKSQRTARNIPSYQEYARAYVTDHLKSWAQRGEFEKLEDYEKRVSKENVRLEQKRLSEEIAEKYLSTYANHLIISELKLRPYDADNEAYAIDSEFGPIYIKVPFKNHEAEMFKNSWDMVQIRNPRFFVKNDNIAIESITFLTPYGKDYSYSVNDRPQYDGHTIVAVDFTSLAYGENDIHNNVSGNAGSELVITAKSDVDEDIPQNRRTNTNTIALVMANEKYSNVANVESALHDGDIFARYCRETLGIPDNQVLVYRNATYGGIMSAVNRLKNSVTAMGSGVDVIVYYAGHGVPDERTKEAYLMPVDGDPVVMASAYPLSRFYKELSTLGAENVMVFIDACFSGANRGDGMLAAARGVVLKPVETEPEGNMFVLSASEGNETAIPYKEKNHGLFTYYLLKKLKDSKGNATLGEISDYVKSEVKKTSSLILDKPQNPKMTVSGELRNKLSKKKLR